MAKYEVKFLDHFEDGSFIECESVSFSDLNHAEEHINYEGMVHITSRSWDGSATICLDKSTLKKFIDELITKMNEIDEEMFTELVKKEVNNG